MSLTEKPCSLRLDLLLKPDRTKHYPLPPLLFKINKKHPAQGALTSVRDQLVCENTGTEAETALNYLV